jgi:hypothetical protein
MVPDKPLQVSTQLIGTNVAFSWNAPDDRGDAIVAYNMVVLNATGAPILDASYCNNIAALTCQIPMMVLNDPSLAYKLVFNQLIVA